MNNTFQKLVLEYQTGEYKKIDFTTEELIDHYRFVFPCLFLDLGVKLSLEQIEKMLDVLTPEQWVIVDAKSENKGSWY